MTKRTILAGTDTWSGYWSPRWLRGLYGYDIGDHGDLDYATVHRGGWEGCRAISQGTIMAWRATGSAYRAPWWLGGLEGHITGHRGGWEGCRALL